MPRYPMTELPGGCRVSRLTVTPKNYKTAAMDKDWVISYRFYDPRYPKPKQVQLRGMNEYKNRKDRIEATHTLIELEMIKLTERGYNPFTGTFTEHSDIDGMTMLPEALQTAMRRLHISEDTRASIRLMLKQINPPEIPVSSTRRKHVKKMLDRDLTPSAFNHYRAYLMMLFKELIECEAIETNPVREIATRKITRKVRQVLTDKERKKVAKYLQAKHPNFYRYLQIFFHSGCRTTELLALRRKDVDLKNQTFTITIHKGKESKQVVRVIKDIALPYWQSLLQQPGEYLFANNFSPGSKPHRKWWVTQFWRTRVKKVLGITADFYSLKHLHTTEVAEHLGSLAAAHHNAHTSTDMVDKVYDVRKKGREDEKVRKLRNEF